MRDARTFSDWIDQAAFALTGTQNTLNVSDERSSVQRYLGVSARTFRRWRANNKAPEWAVRAVIGLCSGVPAGTGSDWNDWRFRSVTVMEPQPGRVRRVPVTRMVLAGPDGHTWRPDDLLRYGERISELKALREREAPGAQLAWVPGRQIGVNGLTPWPGDSTPTWALLEESLRAVIEDALRAGRLSLA